MHTKHTWQLDSTNMEKLLNMTTRELSVSAGGNQTTRDLCFPSKRTAKNWSKVTTELWPLNLLLVSSTHIYRSIYIYVVCYSLPKDFRYTRALSTWFLAPFNPIPNHFHVISKPLFLPPLVHPQHPPFEPEKPTNDFGQEILTTTLNTLNQRLLEFSQIFPICKLLVFFPKKNPVKKLPALDRFPNNKGLWHLSVGDDFNQPRSHLKKFHRSISSNRHRNMVD